MRFPGFEGEWNTHKLGGIAEFSKGKGVSKSDIDENGITECIRYGELYTHYGEVITAIKSKTNIDRSNLVLSRTNDVIIPASGESQIDIATASCVLKEGVALGGDLNIIRTPNNGIFLSYYLNSKKKMQIANLAQGISVVHLYSSQLATLEINLPSLAEQAKIVSLLSSLDQKIDTQIKIIEDLESLLKELSNRLFSKETRFPGFKDKWVRYRVSELLEFFPTNSLSWERLVYLSGSIYNLHYGIIHQGLSNNLDASTFNLPSIIKEYTPKNYSLCQDGDIAFADASEDTNDVGKVVEFLNCGERNIVCGLHTIHARDKRGITINGFKGYAFSSQPFRNQIIKLAQGTKVFSISPKTFMECYIDIPSKQEQLKICGVLAAIDKKIATERLLLILHQQQKQYLLRNLFI